MESNTKENNSNINTSDTHFPAKRIKLKSPEGVVKSIRISDRTPIHAISDIIASRFQGRTPVGVEVDGDLISLDLLYATATENGEYLVEFKKAAGKALIIFEYLPNYWRVDKDIWNYLFFDLRSGCQLSQLFRILIRKYNYYIY